MKRALFLACVLAAPAFAHDAPSGFAFDARCCNGIAADAAGRPSGDCDEIPASAVRIVAGGFIVTLKPGDHPLVKERFTQRIMYGQTMHRYDNLAADPSLTALQLSPDGRWYACIHPEGHILCLYVVPGGS